MFPLSVNLQERKPELTAEVMAFRDYLLSSTISDTLEIWELKGIPHVWSVWWDHFATVSTCSTRNCASHLSYGTSLLDLGHQTTQRIVQALDPLQSMQEINQNFPSIVSSLSRMKVNTFAWHFFPYASLKEFYAPWVSQLTQPAICMQLDDSVKDEIIANQRMVPPGKSLMALNGALINIEDIDLYM